MKYTIDDIPYLVGLHFRLRNDVTRDWVYHIHSYRFEDVYVDWPHRNNRFSPMSQYPVDVFLEKLNDGTWIITDLPSVDISSVLKEESDSLREPKVGDVLIAREDLFYHTNKTRFVTKDKEYPITEVEWGGPGNDGYIIKDDNRSRHTLSLGFIHKHFNIIDHTVNMDHIINQLFESEDDFGWAKDIVSSMPDLPKPNHYVSIIFLKRNQSEDSIHNLLTHLHLLGWRWWTNDYLAIERVLSNITKNDMYDEPHIVLRRNGQLSYGTNLETFEELFGI